MAELTVKYRLDADGLTVKDLVTERDFLAQRLGIPEHLLQVLSWGWLSGDHVLDGARCAATC